jgi:hypothetical protein
VLRYAQGINSIAPNVPMEGNNRYFDQFLPTRCSYGTLFAFFRSIGTFGW